VTARRARRRPGPELWNVRAQAWERWEPVLMNSLAAVNPALLRALDLEVGQRVLDVGCGTGDPALAVAQWVGPRGRVLGIDNSPAMLAVARRRARILRLGNVRFVRADMDRFRHRGRRFDRAVARYALMFAADPERALGAIRASLAPGGILAAAVWGPPRKNPGQYLRDEAVRPFLKEPPPDPERTPHPMRLGRPGLLARLFRDAGFREVRGEAVPVAATYSSLEEYARIQCGSALAETWAVLSPADRRRLVARIERRFRRFQAGAVVRVPGHAFVVSGRR
jgi:enediyne biosynthesis protein CalE5